MDLDAPGFRETVVASPRVNALAVLAGVAAGAGAAAALRDESTGSAERGVSAGVLVVVGVLLLLVWRWFGRLRIDVDERALRFRFGPVGPTLDAARIARVGAEPYRWLRFGGWGWRFARIDGRLVRAYSVPFLRSGVAVEMTDGRRYYVSSRAPEALAEAVRACIERRGA